LCESNTDQIFGFALNNYNLLGVKKNGNEFERYSKMSTFKNVKTIAGGQHHTIVLTADNKVHAIRRINYGRLGLGEVESEIAELKPITLLSSQHIVKISCGESNAFAVTRDRKFYVWGM
jgi:regulator of chromosome condensation